MKSYSELVQLQTFAERLDYLSLVGKVGAETFGNDRPLNQMLYHDPEWKRVRNHVISRDNGCDLGIPDLTIFDRIYIHHITPITVDDILKRSRKVFDLDNLISCSFDTHQKIHYGIKSDRIAEPVVRFKNDMCPWKL